jgi:PKD repeat protein
MTFLFADGRTITIEASVPEITLAEPAGGFTVGTRQWLRITPEVSGSGAIYSWTLDGETVATTKNLHHVFAEAGSHTLRFSARNGMGEAVKTLSLTVNSAACTGGITRVFAYMPAPGQFINTMPEATSADTPETMRHKAEALLAGGGAVCLGGFGGYIEFGFDHTVINRAGNDFTVAGNAFAGGAEPGVIMVSHDVNGNHLPDDPWYEIAGSEHHKPATVRNYEITYHRPEAEPGNPGEPQYIRWTDNRGQTGWLSKNTAHTQTYYPLWMGGSYTLQGTLMEANMYDQSGNGTYWVTQAYGWGYADNHANTDAGAQIDIGWAVDNHGNPAGLKGIDFVKIHTGNRAEGGWTGEISTEVTGFTDLNL